MLINGRIFYDLDELEEGIMKVLQKFKVDSEHATFKICDMNNVSNMDSLEEMLERYGNVYVPKDSKRDDGFEHLYELETSMSDFTVTVSGIADRIANALREKYNIDDRVYERHEFGGHHIYLQEEIYKVFQNTPHAVMLYVWGEVMVTGAVEKAARRKMREYCTKQKEIEEKYKDMDFDDPKNYISMDEMIDKLGIISDKSKTCCINCRYCNEEYRVKQMTENDVCECPAWEYVDIKHKSVNNKGVDCVHFEKLEEDEKNESQV